MLLGISAGNGVLVWIRPGTGPQDGSYAPLARGDSSTPRGAVIAVRTVTPDMTRGFILDSGSVVVRSTEGRISARASGTGTDVAAAQRVALEAAFEAVPPPSDSVDCRTRL